MASLSTPGIGSGLDVNSIVTQLVSIERKPIELLQAQATTIQSKLSSFGLLQSYTANLRDIADKIQKPDFWTANAGTTTDGASVGVSATTTAATGTYSVNVTQLARSQTLSSKAFTGPTSTVGTGTLNIQLGTWNDALTTFTPDAAAVAVNVTIGPGEDTLEAIKTKINASSAGVTASIVADASGSKLVFTSKNTGAAAAVKISVTDDDLNNTDASGLSALAFDPPTAAGQMTQNQSAANTLATINGLPVSSTTNKLDSAISGVTLTFNKVTTSAVDVKVGLDIATMKKSIGDFAKAFSDINKYINDQTKYDANTKKGAALQGDRPTLGLQSMLRGIMLGSSSESAIYSRLSDVGLELQSDGSMKVNDTKLSAALAAYPAEVAKIFSGTASADSNAQGFATRVKALASQLVASDGAITTRTKGLRESVTRNQTQQQKLEQRVEATKARLLKQYGALDTIMSQINATNSSLSQSLKALAAQTEAITKGG